MGKRPGIITAICILGFIGFIPSAILVFSYAARSIGPWYPPVLAASTVVGLISMIGLWKMKRWSIILYASFVVFTQIALLIFGEWSIASLLLPGVVIAIGFSKFKEMD